MSILGSYPSTAASQAARRAISKTSRPDIFPSRHLFSTNGTRSSSVSLSRRRAATGNPVTTSISTHISFGEDWTSDDPIGASYQTLDVEKTEYTRDNSIPMPSFESSPRHTRPLPSSFFTQSSSPSGPHTDVSSEAETSADGLASAQRQHLVQKFFSGSRDSDSIASILKSFQETLPQATLDEAAVILLYCLARSFSPASHWDDGLTRIAADIYRCSLGCRTTSQEIRRGASHAIASLCRDLLQSPNPLHLSFASLLTVDKRLRGSQVRWLLRGATWPLRNKVRELCSTGSSTKDKKLALNLLEEWQMAISAAMQNRKLGLLKGSTSETADSGIFVESAVSHFLVLLAEYGSGASLSVLATGLQEYAYHCRHGSSAPASLPESQHTVGSPSELHSFALASYRDQEPYLPLETVELILRHLLARGKFRQAVNFFTLIPDRGRSLRCYELLLERFGEGEAIEMESTLSPPPSFGTVPFHNKIWQEALGLANRQQAPRNVWLRLYEARMRSHALTGSATLVIRDLKDLRRRGLLKLERTRSTSLSILCHSAQVAMVQCFIRNGSWQAAKNLGEKLISDSRRTKADGTVQKFPRFEAAVLNTLLRGLLDTSDSLTGASARPSLTTAHLQALLREMDELQVRLSLPSDLVTRNILLLAWLRWDQGPSQAGLEQLREILIRCGILIKEGGSEVSCVKTSPRDFLKYDASILRAVARSLFERGMADEGRWVIGVFKEAEKVAKANLKPHERVWKKGRALERY